MIPLSTIVQRLGRSTRRALNSLFDTSSGHDHDGSNSKSVSVGAVGDGTVTDAKLATDVKVGSVAALLTTAKSNIVAAINEIATTLLGVRYGTVTLQGAAATSVVFGAATAAAETGTGTGPFNLFSVGDGATIIVDVDGAGAATATLNAAAGTSVSGASPSTDISLETDTTVAISVDGDAAEDVVLTVGALNTGAAIAAALQVAIRALGGNKTTVTCAYTTVYTITSTQLGTGSAVVVTAPAGGLSLLEELKLGAALGTETAGTGDCADLTAVTCAEIVTLCEAAIAGATFTNVAEALVVTSDTTGSGSSLVFGNGTAYTALGFTNAEAHYGSEGLGYATDMADALYNVQLTLNGVAQGDLPAETVGVTSKATDHFIIDCETAANTEDVDVCVRGTAA